MGRGPETFEFRPIGPLTNPPKLAPQGRVRSALRRGPFVTGIGRTERTGATRERYGNGRGKGRKGRQGNERRNEWHKRP